MEIKLHNEIIEACKSERSMFAAHRKLGIPYETFKRYAKKIGCWNPHPNIRGNKLIPGSKSIPIKEILEGKHPNSHGFIKKLFIAKIKEEKCEECGIKDWNNKPISLQLHHKDGNSHNHLEYNLKILCPNCHSQTPTWGFKKRKRV